MRPSPLRVRDPTFSGLPPPPLPASALELSLEEKLAVLTQLGEALRGGDSSSALLDEVARVRADAYQDFTQGASAAGPGEEDAFPPDFDPGQQLLPRTAVRYRAPFADFFLFLNSLAFDTLGSFFCGGIILAREVRLVLAREGGGPVLFRPVLPPRPATALDFDGAAWPALLARYRLLSILFILLAINAGAWVISLVTVAMGGGGSGNPLQPVWAWQFEALVDFAASVMLGSTAALAANFSPAVQRGASSLIALAAWALLGAILCVLGFWLHVSGKAHSTRLIRGKPGLASVLPLAVTPRAPLIMISYPWTAATRDVARSLAAVLPNAWVDVQMLVPGGNVPKITASVSRWAFCLVICLSTDYLKRSACVLEFVTAALKRKWYQTTVAFLPPGELSDGAKELVKQLGIQVFEDPRELLDHLNNHVYTCTTVEDQQRCSAWFGRVSTVRVASPRGLRMPAPLVSQSSVVRAGGAFAVPFSHAHKCGRCSPARGPRLPPPPPLPLLTLSPPFFPLPRRACGNATACWRRPMRLLRGATTSPPTASSWASTLPSPWSKCPSFLAPSSWRWLPAF
jgi:hypothetical protein